MIILSNKTSTFYIGCNGVKLEQKKERHWLLSQESTRHLGQLFRQYNSVLVSRISFKIYCEINVLGCNIKLLQQATKRNKKKRNETKRNETKRLHQKFVYHIHQIGLYKILCIRSRIQRTMTDQCYVNILV